MHHYFLSKPYEYHIMLTITKTQLEILDLACYRRLSVKFIEQELYLFDCDIPNQDIQVLFDQFQPLLNLKDTNDRLALVLLLIASLAFKDVFTQQAITRFMGEPMTPENRKHKLQYALLQHVGYDSEALTRKSWI